MDQENVEICGIRCKVIPDGPLDEVRYGQASKRVVHLLKEATRDGGLGPKLCGVIRDDGTVKWRLWKVTARRSYCLLNGLPKWEDLRASAFGEALRQSAVVNLNDTLPVDENARFVTNYDEWIRYVRERWDRGRRELVLRLRPNVIVCGGTYSALLELLKKSEAHCLRISDGSTAWAPAELEEPVVVLKAKHPSFRGKHATEYEEFRTLCERGLALGGLGLLRQRK